MNWFFLALVGPLLYAATNHIDKFLLSKYFQEGGVGTLLIFSSLLSIVVVPVLFIFDPMVFNVGSLSILVLSFVGILNIIVLWCYLLALQDDEASAVIVFYQLVPVLGLLLGYLILGEAITRTQFVAMVVILLGTTIMSFDIDANNRLLMRRRTLFLMLAAVLCWALGSVIFKAVAIEENVTRSFFWEYLVRLIAGVCIFGFLPSYRGHFLAAMRKNSTSILSLNIINESFFITGNIIFSFAFMMAPVSLVLLLDSFQPIFVLGIGILLSMFIPELTVGKLRAAQFWLRVIAISITSIGTYLLLAY
ncbi:MAG: EamA family transporter [Alphaproteobacteria bacterium]